MKPPQDTAMKPPGQCGEELNTVLLG